MSELQTASLCEIAAQKRCIGFFLRDSDNQPVNVRDTQISARNHKLEEMP